MWIDNWWIDGEVFALVTMWLGLVTAVIITVVRIALLLREQYRAERAYRFYLARWRGALARETRGAGDGA